MSSNRFKTIDVFLESILRSTCNHIPLKYRCPDYCYVGFNSGLPQVYLDLECLDGHLLASLTVPQFTTNEVNSGVALQMERMGALSPWSHWVVHIAGLVVFLAHHQHAVAAVCILKVCKMINHTIKWAGLKRTHFSLHPLLRGNATQN